MPGSIINIISLSHWLWRRSLSKNRVVCARACSIVIAQINCHIRGLRCASAFKSSACTTQIDEWHKALSHWTTTTSTTAANKNGGAHLMRDLNSHYWVLHNWSCSSAIRYNVNSLELKTDTHERTFRIPNRWLMMMHHQLSHLSLLWIPILTASRSVAATVANREIHSPPVPTQFIDNATHWFAEIDFLFVRCVLVIRWRSSWQGRRNE